MLSFSRPACKIDIKHNCTAVKKPQNICLKQFKDIFSVESGFQRNVTENKNKRKTTVRRKMDAD